MSRRWVQLPGAVVLGLFFLWSAHAWGQVSLPGRTQARIHRPLRTLIGTVTAVSAGSFELATRDGRTVEVQTTPEMRVLRSQRAGLGDLHPGDAVRVVGRASDGSVTARWVSAVPATLLRRASGGGLWQSRNGTIRVVGRLAVPPAGGTLAVLLPAGPPLSVQVPQGTRIVRLVAAPRDSLTPGARVVVRVTGAPGGAVSATTVLVVGPGTPPAPTTR